jgi:hypothetical protein
MVVDIGHGGNSMKQQVVLVCLGLRGIAPNGRDYLTVGASLPKVMYGSNVEMVETQAHVNSALMRISDYVGNVADVNYDVMRANVLRVDFCNQWRMIPSDVCEYLKVIASTSVSRMTRKVFDDSTVQFSNRSGGLVLYDKLSEVLYRLGIGKAAESEVLSAFGVLRLERRFLNYQACERLAAKLGLSGRQVGSLLTIHVAEWVMDQTIKQLGLDETLISGDIRLDRLIQAYGAKRALALAGLLAACDSYGPDNLIRLGICKRSTFHKMRRQIMQAGAWVFTERKRNLPPLRLVHPRQERRSAIA